MAQLALRIKIHETWDAIPVFWPDEQQKRRTSRSPPLIHANKDRAAGVDDRDHCGV